jgi:hypothetical protein
MDLETQQFVNGCLRSAGDRIRGLTTEDHARTQREIDQIHYNGAVALERLEQSGGVSLRLY